MWALLLVGLVSSVAADSAVGVGGAGGSGVGVLPSSGAGHVAGDGHVVYDINAVRFEASAAPSAAGDEALKIFCTCPDELAALPTMCDTVTHQCRQTFCSPVCLRMAWTPVIEVDCSLAPQWSWCSVFAEQVREAAAAVTAQFQAHVCLDRHFCNRTEALIDWIENANYGKHYPEHRLPIASCMQEDAPSGPAARADIHAALCTACERVLKVRLHMNSCIPANAQRGFETMQAGSLQERCLYVRDHIGVHEHDLLSEFRERVCPCLGCCGDKQCYFPNAEHAWLTNLIESVQHRVTTQLAGEGWLNHDGTAPDPRRPSSASARAGAGAGAGTAKKGKRATKRPPTPTPTPTGARASPNVAAQHP